MELRISATALARRLGDVLGRIRYRGDAFVIEKNGVAVARLAPLGPPASPPPLRDALAAWRAAGPPDAAFADDLDAVGERDRPPLDPWAS
jgi:antitoxin (DNA-binding transcriptional repressor) of toxin-antitoxin stability system